MVCKHHDCLCNCFQKHSTCFCSHPVHYTACCLGCQLHQKSCSGYDPWSSWIECVTLSCCLCLCVQVVDSDASTASGGSPPDSPTSVFHMPHQLMQAQKQVDVLRLEKQRMEVRLTTAEAKYQIPEYWLVSCLMPSCLSRFKCAAFVSRCSFGPAITRV